MPTIFRDNFVDDFFSDFMRTPAKKSDLMSTDVKEYEDRFELYMELAGFKKEDIQAGYSEGYLTVKATRSYEEEDAKYLMKERFVGTCERKFYIGDDIKKDEIKAAYTNGVLKLTIPKKELVPEIEEDQFISIE
ncbi:MAG: Hsp20/alpha crystallin family protein [Clostridia bacterium]|nr:Hsp20/alpha crystallin family protein [Clostridia bacterium]